MPQTVLAGPDGKTPAIDARTGTPLTMEEMLRRNGIVATGNNVSMMGPQAPMPAPQGGPPSAVQAAMQARTGGAGNPAMGNAPVASTNPAGGDGDGNDSEAGADAAHDAQMQQMASQGLSPEAVQGLEAAGIVAAGTAAAYAAYKLSRATNPNVPGTDGVLVGDPYGPDPLTGNRQPRAGAAASGMEAPISGGEGGAVGPYRGQTLQGTVIPNGVDVPGGPQLDAPMKRVGDSTQKAMQNRTPAAKAIEGPRSQLGAPTPDRKAAAAAMMERAARGGPSDIGTIEGKLPEGVGAGLLRMLKNNPGLLRTLTKVP